MNDTLRKMFVGLGAFLIAASVGAEMPGFRLKKELKEKSGVVKLFDGSSLRLAVAEGKKMGEMIFAVDALTQVKGRKEELTSGRPVVVFYTAKGGGNVARAIAFQSPPEPEAPKTGGPE